MLFFLVLSIFFSFLLLSFSVIWFTENFLISFLFFFVFLLASLILFSFFLFHFLLLTFSFFGGFGGFISVLISTFTFIFLLFLFFLVLFLDKQFAIFLLQFCSFFCLICSPWLNVVLDLFHLYCLCFSFFSSFCFISFVEVATVYYNNFFRLSFQCNMCQKLYCI